MAKTVSDVIMCLVSGVTVGTPMIALRGKDALKKAEQDKRPGLPTPYCDELISIEQALNQINAKRRAQGTQDLRFVIFIDDLDRCAPERALEVLESVKVVLGISGFICVLGLSPEVAGRCIEHKYGEMGIKGEDYIRKIVQIPFTIPERDPYASPALAVVHPSDTGNRVIAELLRKLGYKPLGP